MNIAKYDVVMIVSIGRITTGQFMLTELTHIYTPCGQYIGQVRGYDLSTHQSCYAHRVIPAYCVIAIPACCVHIPACCVHSYSFTLSLHNSFRLLGSYKCSCMLCVFTFIPVDSVDCLCCTVNTSERAAH